MTEYKFLTTWVFDAPCDRVWDIIVDYNNFPNWWPAVAEIRRLSDGDATGKGSIWTMIWKTPLSYTLSFTSTITTVEPPHRLELYAVGEVDGTGRWELSETETGTQVCYYWTVKTTKLWMNLLALLFKPVLEWNHNAIMKQGGQGLANQLGAKLVHAEERVL